MSPTHAKRFYNFIVLIQADHGYINSVNFLNLCALSAAVCHRWTFSSSLSVALYQIYIHKIPVIIMSHKASAAPRSMGGPILHKGTNFSQMRKGTALLPIGVCRAPSHPEAGEKKKSRVI